MCGIAGFLSFNNARNAAEMNALAGAMADALAHRGPDDRGTWADAEAGIALGHRRLSIIDLSAAGHQPMTSGSGRFVTVYNGEIYNYRDVLEELKQSDSGELVLRGHSDTEVMLAAFDRWGVEATLPRIHGQFAIAIWDRSERALWLVRDRLGKKPLYYARFGDEFMFASELKALRLHPAFQAEIDPAALASYLRLNCVPAPLSAYRGVHKLAAASWLRISQDGKMHGPTAYWSLADIAREGLARPFAGGEQEAADELDQRLRAAVSSRMLAADVPIGLFLSGGVDSSTVTALAQAQSSVPIRTFSIGMPSLSHDESKFARAVAGHLGTDHTQWEIAPQEAMQLIPELPGIYDEPFADSSAIPTLLVSRLARKHVTVALSGDGGDEVFGGYNRHIMAATTWPSLARIPRGARRTLSQGLGLLSEGKWEAGMKKAGAALPAQFRLANLPEKMHKIRRAAAARDAKDLHLRLISNWEEPDEVLSFEVRDAIPGGDEWLGDARPAESMMLADALLYMHDDILVKVDRASMAVSLEVRCPFLDPNVIAFAWTLPLAMKVRDGVGKWIVRQVMNRYIPAELTDHPKMGFSIPLADWLRGPLRDWAESLLSSQHPELLRAPVVQSHWREFLSGRADLTDKVWSLLMLLGWLEASRAGLQARVQATNLG
jgi:asparagine synthase (glutamine-hydrolysing)